MTKRTEHYVSDVPVADRDGDRLRRWPFAQRIADTLGTRSDPASLVVGVYGRWGEGKTTVLEFIEQRLAGHDDVVTVRFNPWLFTSDTELFAGFFDQVAEAIDREFKTTAVGDLLRDYKLAIVGGAKLAGHAAQFFGGIPHAGIMAEAAATMFVGSAGVKAPKASASELRRGLEKRLEEAQKRVVVLVDDIDRLDKHETQAVFRLIKVAADFRWTSYVLALDREIVAGALAEHYPGRADGGDEFLDKIIQVPLTLPPAPPEVLRKLLFSDLDRVLRDSGIELSEKDARRFATEFDLRLMHRVTTPRSAKRYANALQFILPLLRGEVDVVDLLLIEAVRLFHPRMHAAIVRNSETMLKGTEGRRTERAEALKAELGAVVDTETLTGAERGRSDIRLLEELFPRLKSIYGNTTYGESWDVVWAKDKRISSSRYFPRYFSSGVPVGDIPDATVQAVLGEAVEAPSEAAERLRGFLTDTDPDRLVQKLIDTAWDLEGPAARCVVRALVEVGEHFPHSAGAFGEYLAPRGRAALLAARLLTKSTKPRDATIADVLSYGSLPFALQVFRRLQPAESDGGTEEVATRLAEDEWRALGERIAARVQAQAEGQWFLDAPDGVLRLSTWRELGDQDELRSYIEQGVTEDPRRALALVRCFCAGSQSLQTGERYVEPMRSAGYQQIQSLVAPSFLARGLVDTYGSPDPSQPVGGRHVKDDTELAHSFLALHAAANRTDSNAAGPPTEPLGPSSEEPA